ncbi:MAG: hypothetical protein ACRCTY_07995 [Candidatus Adiutrix sp.]
MPENNESYAPHPAGTTIRLAQVRAQMDGHPLPINPLNLSLAGGCGALIIGRSLSLLRSVMEICLGAHKPYEGLVSWSMGEGGPKLAGLWQGYDFFRQIGYVDRRSQLLGNITLIDNLILLNTYGLVEKNQAVTIAHKTLAQFELTAYKNVMTDALPEPQRRLALYALSFCKHPKLFLMERPVQFLDSDFELVWAMVQHQARTKSMAYMVFDRDSRIYSPDDFVSTTYL